MVWHCISLQQLCYPWFFLALGLPPPLTLVWTLLSCSACVLFFFIDWIKINRISWFLFTRATGSICDRFSPDVYLKCRKREELRVDQQCGSTKPDRKKNTRHHTASSCVKCVNCTSATQQNLEPAGLLSKQHYSLNHAGLLGSGTVLVFVTLCIFPCGVTVTDGGKSRLVSTRPVVLDLEYCLIWFVLVLNC